MVSGVAGIVLAGGLSRRMGGGDKPLANLNGKPLLTHVIERLRPQVTALALNANGDASRFGGYALPVIADTVDGFAGPLAGILAGMEWVEAGQDSGTMVSVAGDTPFFPTDLVERLAAAAAAVPGAVAVATSGGGWHPTFSLWPVSLRQDLQRFLVEENGRRVVTFIERNPFVTVDFPFLSARDGQAIDPFFNINTPQDLAEAEAIATRLAS